MGIKTINGTETKNASRKLNNRKKNEKYQKEFKKH